MKTDVSFLSVESRCIPETFTSDDIVCHDLESSVSNEEEEVKKLSACSLITSYQLASNGTTRHKMLTSGKNSKRLKEYDGQIEVKVSYTILGIEVPIEMVGCSSRSLN